VVETGEPFRSLHHPRRRWRKTLQSNASEAPPVINLAVDLSVAKALQTKRVLTTRPTRTSHPCANRLFRQRELALYQPKVPIRAHR
jgi:hypothetical protein